MVLFVEQLVDRTNGAIAFANADDADEEAGIDCPFSRFAAPAPLDERLNGEIATAKDDGPSGETVSAEDAGAAITADTCSVFKAGSPSSAERVASHSGGRDTSMPGTGTLGVDEGAGASMIQFNPC